MEVHIKDLSEAESLGLDVALICASRSKCLSRKVGAYIQRSRGGCYPSYGFNHPPDALDTCEVAGSCCDNERGQCTRCLHAERVAIMDFDTRHKNATIYITCPPCHSCALEIIHANIRRVVCYTHPKTDREAVARLLEAGIEFIEVMP